MHRISWIAALLVVLLAVVVESGFKSEADSISGVPAAQDPGGRRLMLVILDSLTPEDAEEMVAMRVLRKRSFAATVEPCLDRLTKMCIDEVLTGRQFFSLFGLLRNLGPLDTGLGPNLLRDVRAAGKSVAMVTAGDLKTYDAEVDDQAVFKGGYTTAEMRTLLGFAESHDLVIYHYRWHDSKSHRHRVGSRRYKRSLRTMNRALASLKTSLPSDMDLMVLGDHGHTLDGRHLQGLDVPTVMVVRSPRVKTLKIDGRIPLTSARYLAGAVMGLHSPDSRWDPGWTTWLTSQVSDAHRAAVLNHSDRRTERGIGLTIVIPLLAFIGLAGWVGGGWAALAVALIGLSMGVGLEDFVQRVHNAKGSIPRLQHVSWIPLLAGGVIGLGVRRRWRDGWSGVLISVGVVLAILLPINAHYGVMKNATNLIPALVIGTCSAFVFSRRWWMALWAVGVALWAWPHMTWVRFVNLEVRTYKSFRWMVDQPELALGLVALLAGWLAWMLLSDRRWPRAGWALVAALGPVVPLPDEARLGIFILLCGIWLFGPAHRTFLLVQAVTWSLPLVFPLDQQAGVLGIPVATGVALLALREVSDRDWRWRWTGGLIVLLAGYVGMGWTMGLSVSGIDFGFLIRFLPGDLHERLWWLVGVGTVVKVFTPVILIAALTQRILADDGRAIYETASRAAALRVAIIGLCVGGWLMAPESSAAGAKLAHVIQDAFYWSLVGGLGALSWAGLQRGTVRGA